SPSILAGSCKISLHSPLPNLHELILENGYNDNARARCFPLLPPLKELTRLEIHRFETLDTLEPLTASSNLASLYISNARQLPDLSPIGSLPHLTALGL